MTTYYYTAYNLTIASEIHCPQLLPISDEPTDAPVETADVHIRYGAVPEALEDPVAKGVLYQTKPDQFLLRLDDIGGFWVRDGEEVIIEPVPQATDDEVRLFLFGSAFGALLHQRGLLVLHASAVATDQGAVLFVGPSGNGKSTLAAALHKRGYPILADDVCALALDEGNIPAVYPAFPQLKLWADSVQKLAHATGSLRKVRPQLEKFALPLAEGFAATILPLHAVYQLTTRNNQEFELEPVEDANKFGVLLNNTYRARFLDGLEMRGEHFKLGVVTANTVKISRITRPSAPFRLDELADLVEQDFDNG